MHVAVEPRRHLASEDRLSPLCQVQTTMGLSLLLLSCALKTRPATVIADALQMSVRHRGLLKYNVQLKYNSQYKLF